MPPSPVSQDEKHGILAARLGALAALFCVVPPLMILSPVLLAAALPVVIAVALSSILALAALSFRRGAFAALAALPGYLALTLGPVFGGISVMVACCAALAIVLECLAVRGPLQRRALFAGAAIIAAVGLTAWYSPAPAAAAGQGALAAVLLPLAPALVLLALVKSLTRMLATSASDSSRSVRREEAMLAAADVAVVMVDRGAQVMDVTDGAARLMGQSTGALMGRGLFDRVLIADRPAFLNAVSGVALNGACARLRLRLSVGTADPARPTPPTFGLFDVELRPAAGGAGEVALVLSVIAAEAPVDTLLTMAGPQLFATLSHEVRTPMNAILGFSEILSNEALAPRDPAQVAEYAAIIHRSAQDAFSVTRAVVDLLRVEAGEFADETENVFLAEALGGVIASVSGREPDDRCTFDLEAVLSDDAAVKADPRALRMLLSTLVEGLVTAQTGGCDMVCAITSVEGRPAISMVTRARGETADKPGKHNALLAVVGLLVRRIAGLLGAEVEFDPPHGARIIFQPVATVAVRRHRPGARPSENPLSLPLRKSA